MSREKFNPPTPDHRLWMYVHEHEHGADGGLFWATGPLSEDEAAKALDLDFEPKRNESLTISLVTCEQIPTLP